MITQNFDSIFHAKDLAILTDERKVKSIAKSFICNKIKESKMLKNSSQINSFFSQNHLSIIQEAAIKKSPTLKAELQVFLRWSIFMFAITLVQVFMISDGYMH